MKYVAAYLRSGGADQAEVQLNKQRRAIEENCNNNEYVVVKTYVDRSVSGISDKRPAFQQMIADSEKSLFDAVIVHRLDRLSRSKLMNANYKHILKMNGVKLLSATENLDDLSESTILYSLNKGMAEYYEKYQLLYSVPAETN
ncbi:recombinase family protein [Paenibacillus sp. GCM10012307]|uniref:Recombinase family protein n=2 Tax=Paenibacillus roseus TaxID=2798579 RepID=A0A934J3N1_9BACL|nr:recombinase family protein [Paenibacillus roseus]